MTLFFDSLDPTLLLVVVAPLILTIGAWTLRMACAVCAVDVPTFWHAMLTLVILLIANVVLQFFLQVTATPETLGTRYLAPMLTGAAVIAISLPTGPLSACMVSVVYSVLTALIYLGASMAAGVLHLGV